MSIKLFTNSHIMTYDEMPASHPVSYDHSDPQYQAEAHENAGYSHVGDAPTNESCLRIFSDDTYLYRSQNGELWAKEK